MNNIFKTFGLLVLIVFFGSCRKSDTIEVTPPVPYAEQYPIDAAAIEDYLETHSYSDVDDELVNLESGQVSLKDDTRMTFKIVNRDDVEYKIYYLVLDEGLANAESPIRVDSAFVKYKGNLLNGTVFDLAVSPVWFKLDEVVLGWTEIVPKFRTGETTVGTDGSVTYSSYGKGIMFLPSAFGYYNSSVGSIPAYSPLIFNFELINQRHRDHDQDGILSINEYYNAAGDLMDTDGDKVPDYLDIDDDGDGVLTKQETRFSYTDTDNSIKYEYYPFNGAAVDDPSTPYDDTRGIPSCSGDFTSETRLRKYLDPSCQ